MDLLSFPKLETMLEMPQERISGGQLVEIMAADMPLVMQFLQREESSSGAQPRLGASVNSLQTLNQELDITHTAAINLDIGGRVAFGSDLLSAFAIDFFTRHKSGLDCHKVDLLAVNLRLHSANEAACKSDISGGVTDLDQSLAFPVVRGLRVVAQCVRQADRQLTFVPLRTQTKINSKDGSFGCGTGENLGEMLGETNEIFSIRNLCGRRFATVSI